MNLSVCLVLRLFPHPFLPRPLISSARISLANHFQHFLFSIQFQFSSVLTIETHFQPFSSQCNAYHCLAESRQMAKTSLKIGSHYDFRSYARHSRRLSITIGSINQTTGALYSNKKSNSEFSNKITLIREAPLFSSCWSCVHAIDGLLRTSEATWLALRFEAIA